MVAMVPITSRLMLTRREYWGAAIFSIPNDSPTIAIINRMKPLKSKGFTVGSVWFGMTFRVMIMPSTPIGRLIRKIQCHVATSTSHPPKVGPINGPINPARLIKLMAERNCERGIIFSNAKRPTGISNAPPTPCITRKNSS